jgi:MFS family permease
MTPLPRLTGLQWLICAIAALGFAFDIYEVLVAPLVVGPAIGELTGARPGSPAFNYWVGMFFWVPAIVGGSFGLLGGYLTDRFGRRSVLVWSILLYTFSRPASRCCWCCARPRISAYSSNSSRQSRGLPSSSTIRNNANPRSATPRRFRRSAA